ncbi:hypothetical protein [Actinoplanes awajinensis]|uniref:Uncharacterized protein n=1 Tax=Actinoplanes awajinensis subsp. mycoplanecinus TaxID=135947 RepID=A0A117MPM6_9ACTN|nr:hypothetical protein [Actinoplanes awajinensis]KUL28902.1 hypothetical protein ADL15_30095 [Actinoplanes awajinensis subsp. mycoplanecinus]
MSVSRLNRTPQTSSVPPVRPSARERHQNAHDDADALSDRDRELIYQATGQRIDPGQRSSGWINSLAGAIAADRTAGRLAPGQEVTPAYLKDLSRRYDQATPGRNPVAGYLEPALRYLSQRGDGRLDVTA